MRWKGDITNSHPSLPFAQHHYSQRLSAIRRTYFTRRRAVYALIVAITLFVFLRASSHHDDFSYEADGTFDVPVNPDYQPSYIAISVPSALPSSARPRLRPVRDLPHHCLDGLYTSGEPCHDALGPTRMDVVWTWVNGSDPLFAQVKERAIATAEPNDPYRPVKKNNPSRMFRDHDELRHSVRSVLTNFQPYANGFRILTSDFDYPKEGAYERALPKQGAGYWRLGLQPQWLAPARDRPRWHDGDVELSLTHHAQFMNPYHDTVFNSYAIESQIIHLQNLTETFIYMNDDFYMASPLTPASFYTSPYGIVLRLQSGLQVSPKRPTPLVQGERRSVGESNWLLSNRFGKRRRPYVAHEAKSLSAAIVHELALVWPTEIAATATHRFRETEGGHGDFYLMFVHAHYIVERAREALLWAWVVGRIGTLDDGWGDAEAERAWTELGGVLVGVGSEEVHVLSCRRETLDPHRVYRNLREAGYNTDTRTELEFSSLDGYPYGHTQNKGKHGWGGYDKDDERLECTIKRSECFDVRGRASDLFKHIAFERPACGDCVIQALVKASGPLGLSAFLPSRDRHIPVQRVSRSTESRIPHLPLVKDWHDGQFALGDVMHDAHTTSVRQYALMVLQRYRYVIGGTPSMFESLQNYEQVRAALRSIDRRKDLALLCINDDLGEDDSRVSRLFTQWQEKKWPTPAAWEADVSR
ncbi:hypothetical protein FKP32DRAFT_1648980 [Trametes sanguinea]|nr:hypothetical protein FKP32DRAFT_1648980 [Trametes sanguinea]